MAEQTILASAESVNPAGHTFRRGEGFRYVTAGLLRQGRVRITRPGYPPAVVGAQGLVLVRPGIPYLLATGDGLGWSECWVIARPGAQQEALTAAWPTLLPGICWLPLEQGPWVQPLVQALGAIPAMLASAHPLRHALAANAWEQALLLARGCLAGPGGLHPAVQAACELMAARLAEHHSLASLARAVHCSASHLAELFRSQLGEPPMRHLRRRRLERAEELLLGTALPVGRIATAVGFPDPFHFSTCFRARAGCSPREFRGVRGADGDARSVSRRRQ